MAILLNAVLFQVGWLLCVTQPTWAPATAAVALAVHFTLIDRGLRDLPVVLASLACGASLDALLMRTGLIDFGHGHAFPPFWMLGIWALFATSLNHSLRWLQALGRWRAPIGAVAGPFAYWSGVALGEATWSTAPWIALVVLSLTWSLILPILSALAHRSAPIRATTRSTHR
ncbi:MAG: DUF2878 domain-containing protein [Pseudomonadota bacterium]|nr:DUF2878 domain-containing protein [Pseudomonadota bacterium]